MGGYETLSNRLVILTDGYPPSQQGGAEKMASISALQAVRDGYDVHVLTGADQPAPDRLHDGITVHTIAARIPERWIGWIGLYNPLAIRAVRALLRELKPRIVHVHNVHHRLSWGVLPIARRYAQEVRFTAHDLLSVVYGKMDHFCKPGIQPPFTDAQLRIPTLHNLRSMRTRYNPIRNTVIRAWLSQVNTRYAVSDLQRRALEANGLPPFTVRHNQINSTAFQTDPTRTQTFQQRYGLHDRKVILFAGRVTRQKGSDQLIRAFARVRAARPDALLLILMHGDLAVEAPYQHLLDHGHIRLSGWLQGDDLAQAYHAAACVCVPSLYLDPFPTVVLEAIAAERPVLISHFSGGTEAIREGQTGYTIDPFDTNSFADRLLSVIT